MLPKDFPPWQTVYRYFQDWMKNGTWERIHGALYCAVREREGRQVNPTLAMLDAQFVKTGPDARGEVGFDAGKNVKAGNVISSSIFSA